MNDPLLTYRERAAGSCWLHASPLALALGFALAAAGCEVHTHSGTYVGSDEGTLVLDWTLDDSTDPRACDDFDARDAEIIIYDDRGSVLSRIRRPCDDFGVDVDLLDGVYSLDATLLDRSGHDVTTTLPIDGIDVYADEDTPISIDFPLDSIR